MTSYQFEVAAKNAVVDIFRDEKDIEINISDIDLVWFAHVLGNKKCTIWGSKMGSYYAEVTYNVNKREMYVDIYDKESNRAIPEEDFNFSTAKRADLRSII